MLKWERILSSGAEREDWEDDISGYGVEEVAVEGPDQRESSR